MREKKKKLFEYFVGRFEYLFARVTKNTDEQKKKNIKNINSCRQI